MTPAFDYLRVNDWERRVRIAIGIAHDLMEVSPAKASLKLTEAVGYLSEWQDHCSKVSERDDARVEQDSTPGPDLSWVMNGGR